MLVGAVIAVAVVLTRDRRPEGKGAAGDPVDELDRRYARGEIDRETYLQVRGDLQQARGSLTT